MRCAAHLKSAQQAGLLSGVHSCLTILQVFKPAAVVTWPTVLLSGTVTKDLRAGRASMAFLRRKGSEGFASAALPSAVECLTLNSAATKVILANLEAE